MDYTDLYQMVEQDVFAFLQSDPKFCNLPGAVIEPGSVEGMIAEKVGKAIGAGSDGKVGLGYIVLPIEELMDDYPEDPFSALKIPIGVQIIENTILNHGPRGRKLPIRALAAYGEKILKVYSAANLTTDFIPEKNAINLFTPDRDKTLRICQINLYTYESDVNIFQQVSSPFLTPSAPVSQFAGQNVYPFTVTIAAPDSDFVYYTTDGSPPWKGNGAAAKWDGQPVAVTGPCFFRTRGFSNTKNVGSKCSSIYFA